MPRKSRGFGWSGAVSKARHQLKPKNASKPKASKRDDDDSNNGGGGTGGVKDRFRQVLGPPRPVRPTPTVTEEAVHTLLADIGALAKEEREILDQLDLSGDTLNSSELPALERAASDLTRINDQLVAKTGQLPPPAELDKYLEGVKSLDDHTRRLARRDEAVWKDRDLLPELRSKIALSVTGDRARRRRARRRVSNEQSGRNPANGGGSPTNGAPTNIFSPTPIEHHDVLVVAPQGVHDDEAFYRFPVIKAVLPNPNGAGPAAAKAVPDAAHALERVGQYSDKPELHDAYDDGQRRTLSVVRPQDWGPASVRATQRGPAFATLPLKPEPEPAAGVESSQCYLINTQNLNFRNAWTAEEWNDTPGGVDLPPAQGAMKNEVEALLAGPQGKVFRLALTHISEWKRGMTARIIATSTSEAGDVQQRELGAIESVNLGSHMEVWHQLRGGTAMGRVYFDDASGPRVIPLVNITTLTRD
jgi:hypothetical protein